MSDWFKKEDEWPEGEKPTQPLSRLPGQSAEEHMRSAARAMDALQQGHDRFADDVVGEFREHADEVQGKSRPRTRPSQPQWPE